MRRPFFHFQGHARLFSVGLPSLVLGTALQLQQGQLWGWAAYAAIALLAPLAYALTARGPWSAGVWRLVLAALALGLLGFGATGLRATAYLQSVLNPALEGRDLRVTGVVANLPQRNEAGLRFRLDVEAALLDGQAVQVPPRMDVGWYGDAAAVAAADVGRLPADVRAGERWVLTLRFKAPHGTRNPHGFDYELYLWEQGVQATGYVRVSAKDEAPQRLGQTWQHPVVLARQVVRERIYGQVQQRQFAGMLAALVVGDQAAIDGLG